MREKYIKDYVSVITPTFNSARVIVETVESVRKQTFPDWEMLITDDCSSDATCSVIEEMQQHDSRIKLSILPTNSGAAVARNNSLNQAVGQYVAFLDADDLWSPEKLEHQLDFIRRTGAGISFTVYREMDEEGQVRDKYVDSGSPSKVGYHDMLKKYATMGCLTVMVDRFKVGNFLMPDIRTGQDYATWLQILKRGYSAFKLDECCSLYRISSYSISRNKYKKAKRQWEIYRKLEGLNVLYASWCFIHYAWRAVNRR